MLLSKSTSAIESDAVFVVVVNHAATDLKNSTVNQRVGSDSDSSRSQSNDLRCQVRTEEIARLAARSRPSAELAGVGIEVG
jgi:hypothetical protein